MPKAVAGLSDIVARFGLPDAWDLYFLPSWSEAVVSAAQRANAMDEVSPERCICQCASQSRMTANINLGIVQNIHARTLEPGPMIAENQKTLGDFMRNLNAHLPPVRRRRRGCRPPATESILSSAELLRQA